MTRRVVAATAAVAAVSALCLTGLGATQAGAAHAASVKPIPDSIGHVFNRHAFQAPPTTADCESSFGIACYGPTQFETAYDTAPLFARGVTGAGRTIAIVDAFGSPTIQADLTQFDSDFGLPDPPSFKIIQPAGPVPTFDPNNPDMAGWDTETSLDVEYAHAMAPGANILLVETPVAETEGVQGFPEIVKAEKFVINHHLADVITQSFGATEQTFPSKASLLSLRGAYKDAARNHVTMLASSGDDGATDSESDGTTLFPMRVSSWPSSDPLGTSVGGTQLFLDADGNHTSPDVAWNDGFGASGGGVSSVFARPLFQIGEKKLVGNARGVPDVAMSAAVDGGAIVLDDADPSNAGYFVVGGTSEASPEFSGIVADAAQLAHHSLGQLDPALYEMQFDRQSGLVDVTSGNNTFNGVTGFDAGKGYDLVTGVGTVDAAKFVPSLAVFASLPAPFGRTPLLPGPFSRSPFGGFGRR